MQTKNAENEDRMSFQKNQNTMLYKAIQIHNDYI